MAEERGNTAAELYLNLLKKVLINWIYGEHESDFNRLNRENGLDWPPFAHSMVGRRRLDSLHRCIDDVLRSKIPGDFIELGVWRGGACILMRGALEAYGDDERLVWVADSFAGLPKPDEAKYPEDAGDALHTFAALAVSLEDVKRNFDLYGLLDDRVRFLKGWFADTLPNAPIGRLSILRLDGDMYGSTMEALSALYPKLSAGGYCIVDDYALKACRAAVHDYRKAHAIDDPLERIDDFSVLWKRRS